MSGLEVFGAVITALDATISIFSAVQDAVDNAKDLPELLEEYQDECRMSKTIIQNVQANRTLRQKDVTMAVVKVGSTVIALDQHLKTLDQGRGRFREMGHQLLSGTGERKKLEKLMGRVTRAKSNLNDLITIVSSQAAAPVTRRVVRRNKAGGSARQFNAPVVKGKAEEDPWKHITEVIVEDNEATERAVQLNTAMTTGNVMFLLNILAEDEEKAVDEEIETETRVAT